MGDPLIARTADLPRESFGDDARGTATWFTFFSADRTSTNTMTAGVMELEPGGVLLPHRHDQPEIYFLASGSGLVTVDGIEKHVAPGEAVFIPGDAEHGLKNTGSDLLRVFYVFQQTALMRLSTGSRRQDRKGPNRR